jgi:glycosyltransferase involved in cell wall biosynthesis
MSPLVSIVMPTYNQGKFIRQAVESILAQTFTDFELIVVDDGSTDDTADVLASIRDARLSVIRQPNGGTGSALNTGFLHTTGPFETWFASDNVMFPDCLATLVNFLEQCRDVDFVYANCEIRTMDATGLVEVSRKNLLDEVISQDWDLERFLANYHLGICWLWRRKLRLKTGGAFQLEVCEDYDMAIRMAAAGGRFAHTPECLGWFRRHRYNLSCKIAGRTDLPTLETNLVKWRKLTGARA